MSGLEDGIKPLVSHVDILPTVLGVVGAVEPFGIDGHSFLLFCETRKQRFARPPSSVE